MYTYNFGLVKLPTVSLMSRIL